LGRIRRNYIGNVTHHLISDITWQFCSPWVDLIQFPTASLILWPKNAGIKWVL
jgi:hypothetical protein